MNGQSALKRLLPVLLLVVLTAAFLWFRLDRYLTLDALRDNREQLVVLVEANRLLAALSFAAVYALVVAISVPVGAILTISSGFLFGLWLGALLSVIGGTLGAVAVFLIARHAIGDALRARAGPFLRRMEEGFNRNAFSYMLFLRLVPVFPFWAVNLAPAFLHVKLRPYALATLIGIVPGTLAFTSIGDGLGLIFDAGIEAQTGDLLSPADIALRIGLALLVLLPVVVKKIMERRRA